MKSIVKNVLLLTILLVLMTGCPDPDQGENGDVGKIVFSSDRDGDNEIYVIDANGQNLVQLTHNTAGDSFPDWSPDGSQIVFSNYSGDHLDIFVIDSDGENMLNITNNSDYDDDYPRWSPDGNKIVFMSDRDWDSQTELFRDEIYTINPDGTNLTRVTTDGDTTYYKTPDWSPDSNQIICGGAGIYIMNTDGSGFTVVESGNSVRYPGLH